MRLRRLRKRRPRRDLRYLLLLQDLLQLPRRRRSLLDPELLRPRHPRHLPRRLEFVRQRLRFVLQQEPGPVRRDNRVPMRKDKRPSLRDREQRLLRRKQHPEPFDPERPLQPDRGREYRSVRKRPERRLKRPELQEHRALWELHRERRVLQAHRLRARSVTPFVLERRRRPDNFVPARHKAHGRGRHNSFVREPEHKDGREQHQGKDVRAARRRVFRNGREVDREADATTRRPWERSVPEQAYRKQSPASRSMRASLRRAADR